MCGPVLLLFVILILTLPIEISLKVKEISRIIPNLS